MSPTAIPGNLILQSPTANDPLLDLNTQPSLDLQFATSKTLNDRVSGQNLITFSRSTTGTYVDSNGIIQTAAIDTPRFDHDPTTGESLGLLIEESRTNLVTYSEDLGNWSSTLWTITTDAIAAPDGNTTADLAVPNLGTSSQPRNVTVSVTAGVQYVATIFAKAKEMTSFSLRPTGSNAYRCVFTLTGSGTAAQIGGSGSITALPNGWYRCVYAFTEPTGGVRQFGIQTNETSDGVSGFYVWGAQLEAGAFPTSYIPTSGSTGPRAADVASITGSNFSRWYNQSEGTVFVDSSALGLNTFNRTAYITDGSTSNSLGIVETSSLTQFLAYTGGVLQANLSLAQTGLSKKAFAYAVNDAAFTADGNSALTDTSVTLPGLDRMDLSSRLGADPLNGHISRLTYYPYRLPDATLQEITS